MGNNYMKRGEWVEVRSWPEIKQTLDENGTLENMPFMPEMLAYCGQRFRVASRADKTCGNRKIERWASDGMRKLQDVVHLEMQRCDGSAHGGCQAGCTFFWKEAWLKQVREGKVTSPLFPPPVQGEIQDDYSKKFPELRCSQLSSAGTVGYTCQATELIKASAPLSFWSLGHFWRDIRSGNVRYRELIGLLIWFWHYLCWFAFKMKKRMMRIDRTRTPKANLNLRPGDLVQINTKAEILRTLNNEGKNRGLAFNAEMLRYAGKRFIVERRIERMIDPANGQLITLKNPCIALRGVACRGHCTFCTRALYHYWHEVWLCPVSEQQQHQEQSVVDELMGAIAGNTTAATDRSDAS